MKTKEFIKWCKKNKRELNEFADIKFNASGFDWLLSYKLSYNRLNESQKVLSDKLVLWLKGMDEII